MKIKKSIITSVILAGLSISSYAQEFQKYPGGLEYKIIEKGTGSYIGKPGDIGEMHITFMLGDSTILDSRKMNNNIPFEQPLMNPATENDVFVGINKMVDGEVAIFRLNAPEFFKNSGQQMPEWVKPSDFASWKVEMVKVINKEASEKLAKEKAEKQIKIDDEIILKSLNDQKIKVKELPKKGEVKANPKIAYKDSTGIYYIITKEGKGAKAIAGKTASMNYTGSLLDGTKFDSNTDSAFHHVQPLEFKVDGKQMIKGWDRMAAIMNVGQKVIVYIPSGLAYGAQARPPHIQQNSILKFEMELLDLK